MNRKHSYLPPAFVLFMCGLAVAGGDRSVDVQALTSLNDLKLDYTLLKNFPQTLAFVYERETAEGKRVQTGTVQLNTLIEGNLATLEDRFNLIEGEEVLNIEVRSICMMARLLRPSAVMAQWQSAMRDEQARIVVAGNNAQRWDRENRRSRIDFPVNTMTSVATYRLAGLLPREDRWLGRVDVFIDAATMQVYSPVVVRCEAIRQDERTLWRYAWHTIEEMDGVQTMASAPILQVLVNDAGVPVQIRFATAQWRGTFESDE